MTDTVSLYSSMPEDVFNKITTVLVMRKIKIGKVSRYCDNQCFLRIVIEREGRTPRVYTDLRAFLWLKIHVGPEVVPDSIKIPDGLATDDYDTGPSYLKECNIPYEGAFPYIAGENVLNVGCGSKHIGGMVSVDIFDGPGINRVVSMDNLHSVYRPESVSGIYCEHALEHVGWEALYDTLRSWWVVLMYGGLIQIKLPDLQEICSKYLQALQTNDFHAAQWYKYTMYGIQRSLSGEPDEAQYHRAGYSIKEMVKLLNEVGFVCEKQGTYDGYGTPSFEIIARKPHPV